MILRARVTVPWDKHYHARLQPQVLRQTISMAWGYSIGTTTRGMYFTPRQSVFRRRLPPTARCPSRSTLTVTSQTFCPASCSITLEEAIWKTTSGMACLRTSRRIVTNDSDMGVSLLVGCHGPPVVNRSLFHFRPTPYATNAAW